MPDGGMKRERLFHFVQGWDALERLFHVFDSCRPTDNNLARVDQECFKSVPSDPPVPPLFFGVWSRAHARALRAGALCSARVSVPVHGGPYSLRSEAFLGRSFSTRAALPIIEEYKGAFPRSRALSG